VIRLAIVLLAMLTACEGTRGAGSRSGERVASTSEPAAGARKGAVEPCPLGMDGFLSDHSYWVHELFPSCPPAPFTVDGIICDGACPMPCRETHRTVRGDGDQGWQRTFTYVDGRIATVKGATDAASVYTKRWDDTCEYQAGRLVSCTTPMGATRIERDAEGRITAVDGADPNEELKVTYRDDGRVATLFGRQGYLNVALHYDAAGRLAAEEDLPRDAGDDLMTRYAYDVDGRVTSVTMGDQKRTYDHSTGLLIEQSEVVSYGGRGVGRHTTTFSYDAQRRPVRVVIELSDDEALEYEYEYECADR
jgi:YD repeat-containing protein